MMPTYENNHTGCTITGEFTATFRAFDMSEESGKYLMEKIRCH